MRVAYAQQTRSDPTPPKMSAAKPDRALHIPAHVLRIPGASLTAKAVLAEVLDLYKVSGHVFAGDDHFAERLGIGKRTVGVAIKWLEDEQHLVRVVNYRLRSKRVLQPSDAILNSHDAPAESDSESAINLKIVHADSATTPADLMQNLHEVDAESASSSGRICMKSMQNLHEVDAESAYINTNLNTTLNTTSNTTLKSEGAAAAASSAEKKIGVAEEVEKLPADEPTASASHTGGARPKKRVATAPPEWRLPAWATEVFTAGFEQWLTYRQARPRKPLQPQSIQLLLDRLAEFDEAFCLMLFRDAITAGWQGLIFDTTPAKYETYKANQLTPSDPTQHAAGFNKPAFGNRPKGRPQYDLGKMRAINAHLSGNE